jgi:hypothetical protein
MSVHAAMSSPPTHANAATSSVHPPCPPHSPLFGPRLLFSLALAQLRSLFTTAIFNIFVSPTSWSMFHFLSFAGKMCQTMDCPVRLAADLNHPPAQGSKRGSSLAVVPARARHQRTAFSFRQVPRGALGTESGYGTGAWNGMGPQKGTGKHINILQCLVMEWKSQYEKS